MIEEDALVGIQDMGAAGITCCTTEMSEKGNSGMVIDLDKVPLREPEMTPYEIMLSESQERMLAVVKKGCEDKVKQICDKWDLICEQVGYVTNEPILRVYQKGEKVAEIPPYHCVLGGGAPIYHREYQRPKYLDEVQNFYFKTLKPVDNLHGAFLGIFKSTNLVSKKWVYNQYDYMVRTNTAVIPGGDASVIRIKGTNKALSMKTDCNARYVYLNPRRGGQIAVAEAARNVVCTGAEPLAITDCLNFGNPYDPEVFYMFREAVAGIGEACKVLNTPVTGGNVSFYNESPDSAVYPTPVVGMVGLIEDISHITTAYFRDEGDLIYLIGDTKPEIGGSEFLKEYHGLITGNCPGIDLEIEKKIQQAVLQAIRKGWIKSAHDLSDGGLAVALAECCIMNQDHPIGASIQSYENNLSPEYLLFSESQSRFLLSTNPALKEDVEKFFRESSVVIYWIGKVGGSSLKINDWLELPLETLRRIYYQTIPELMTL